MASMKGFFAFRGFPGALAAVLAAAGAAGLGPPTGPGGAAVAVVDVSPSARPPDPLPSGARTFADSRIGPALRAAAASGATRFTLFTDGCDPGGTPPADPGVPVDVVLLDRSDDVGLLGLSGPGRVPAGTDFAVRVVLGRTAGPGEGEARAS